jgi:LPS export ABC transporter protein LptC
MSDTRTLAFVLLMAVLVGSCARAPTEGVVAAETPEMSADRVLYRATFNVTVEGVRRALQRSDSMYMYEDSSTARLFGVDLTMFDSIGNRTASVRSQRGRLDLSTQEMAALGKVVVVLADGTRIESEELNYDPQSQRIWSDVETRQVWPDGGVTTFSTFRTDEKFSFFDGTNMRGRAPGLTF